MRSTTLLHDFLPFTNSFNNFHHLVIMETVTTCLCFPQRRWIGVVDRQPGQEPMQNAKYRITTVQTDGLCSSARYPSGDDDRQLVRIDRQVTGIDRRWPTLPGHAHPVGAIHRSLDSEEKAQRPQPRPGAVNQHDADTSWSEQVAHLAGFGVSTGSIGVLWVMYGFHAAKKLTRESPASDPRMGRK